MAVTLNPDKEIVKTIREGLKATGGYCPCRLERTPENKWFALFLTAPGRAFGLDAGSVDVMNVKCDPVILPSLIDGAGLFPAYHMNKQHWLSIALDGSVPMDKIIWLVDASYMMTMKKQKRRKHTNDCLSG